MIDVLDILKRLQQAKKADGVVPTIVDMVEIQQAASKAPTEGAATAPQGRNKRQAARRERHVERRPTVKREGLR